MAIVTYGTMVNNALAAAEGLRAKGINCGVFQIQNLHPLPEEELKAALSGYKHVLIVEECCSGSGVSQALVCWIREFAPDCKVQHVDLGPNYVTHGNLKDLYRITGLDANGILKKVQEVLKVEN